MVLRARVEVKYRFIQTHQNRYPVTVTRRLLEERNSVAGLQLEKTAAEFAYTRRQLLKTKIRQFWVKSGCNYGYRNITLDLKSDG